MRAGKLRHRLRIEQAVDVRDTGGGFTRTWSLLDVVHAEIASEDAGEPLDAGSLTSTQRHKVSIRYRTGVTPSMRLVPVNDTDRVFRILSVVDEEGRQRELVLTCEEKVGQEVA